MPKREGFCEGLPLELVDLFDPKSFYTWRDGWLSNKRPLLELVDELKQLKTAIALVRAGILVYEVEDFSTANELLGFGLNSGSMALEGLSTSYLTNMEVMEQRQIRDFNDLRQALSPKLLEVRTKMEKAVVGVKETKLILEARRMIEWSLYLLNFNSGDLEKALKNSNEITLLSRTLQVERWIDLARIQSSEVLSRSGRYTEALEQFEIISNSKSLRPLSRELSVLNRSLMASYLGDDPLAASLLDIPTTDPRLNDYKAEIVELIGLFKYEFSPLSTQSNGIPPVLLGMLKALRVLTGELKFHQLEKLVVDLESFPREGIQLRWFPTWAKAMAYVHLGKFQAAAHELRGVELPSREMRMGHLFIAGIKLEIQMSGPRPEHIDVLEVLTDVNSILLESPAVAQKCLVKRFMRWHPKAAALLAFSPGAHPTLQLAGDSVFRIGRPIEVFRQGVAARYPFLKQTLEDFGIKTVSFRDMSVDYKRLEKVTAESRGAKVVHRLMMSPAKVAFVLALCSSKYGESWRNAAIELMNSHGLVPFGQGDKSPFQNECRRLESALRLLILGKITYNQFVEINH